MQYQAEIKQILGQPIRLHLGEEIKAVAASADAVIIMISTTKIKEYTVGYKVEAVGTKLLTYTRVSPSEWTYEKRVIWDEDFVPYEVGTRGGRSVADAAEHKRWEDDCYRPGNGTRLGQRDSSDRQFQGYDYTRPQFYATTSERS